MLRLCWRYLRLSRIEGRPLGPCSARLGQVGPILGLSWAHVGPMLALGLCWPCLAQRRCLKPQETSSNMTAQASKTDPLATLKHNGSEGRMAPAACSRSCLGSQCEATRSKLQHDCSGFQNGIFRHTEIPWQ